MQVAFFNFLLFFVVCLRPMQKLKENFSVMRFCMGHLKSKHHRISSQMTLFQQEMIATTSYRSNFSIQEAFLNFLSFFCRLPQAHAETQREFQYYAFLHGASKIKTPSNFITNDCLLPRNDCNNMIQVKLLDASSIFEFFIIFCSLPQAHAETHREFQCYAFLHGESKIKTPSNFIANDCLLARNDYNNLIQVKLFHASSIFESFIIFCSLPQAHAETDRKFQCYAFLRGASKIKTPSNLFTSKK